jgi:hypothetical protein
MGLNADFYPLKLLRFMGLETVNHLGLEPLKGWLVKTTPLHATFRDTAGCKLIIVSVHLCQPD